MKHSPVLVLGLTTLMLGTASAVYAAPLNLDSASPEATTSHIATPHGAAKEETSAPFQSFGSSLWDTVLGEPDARSNHPMDNQSADKSPRYPPSARLPSNLESFSGESPDEEPFNDRGRNEGNNALTELPLFQLPPFQADVEPSPASDPPPSYAPPSNLSSSESTLPESSARSPFALPDRLTDAELFEPDSLSRQPSRQPDSQPDRPLENSQPDRYRANHQIEPFANAEASPLLTEPPHAGRNPSPESPAGSFSESFPERSSANRQLAPSVTASNSIGLNFDPPPTSASRAFSSPSFSSSEAALSPDIKPTSEPANEPANEPASEPDRGSSNSPPVTAEPSAEPAKPNAAELANASLDALFSGDSDSLVAIAVGSAEGTRGPDGSKNPAYHGHVDPGNGVWNLGSFSYQHGANSPEEADTKQLARLRSQAETILNKAEAKGLKLSLEERLNGIDLANQAPKAALDAQGYIDWLADAHAKGMTGSDAILWARVQSFIDPSTQTWDAPGLGNSETRITQDQERRMLAIARAIALYLQDIANSAPSDDGTNDQAMQWIPDGSMHWSTG